MYEGSPVYVATVYNHDGDDEDSAIEDRIPGVYLRLYHIDLKSYIYVNYNSTGLVLTLPRLGYFNHNKTVVFCQRKSTRNDSHKYIRGLHPGVIDLSIQRNIENYIPLSELSMQSVMSDLLLYYKTPFREAITELYKCEVVGLALSRNLALKVNHNLNRIVLFSREVPIGVYVHLKKHIRLFTNSFNSELDALNIPYAPFLSDIKYSGGYNTDKVNPYISERHSF
jgi:hypothetical protein